jgi:hypothetical protein
MLARQALLLPPFSNRKCLLVVLMMLQASY